MIARRIARSATPSDRSASMDRRDEVVAVRPTPPASAATRSPVVADRLGGGAQLGGDRRAHRSGTGRRRRRTSSPNARTLALSSPTVDQRASDPVAVRADIGALAGYHSPQVDADVRLNTNESPFPPPAVVAGRVPRRRGRRSRGTAIRTGGRRRCAARSPASTACRRRAGLRRQRVERGHPVAAAGVRRGRAARSSCSSRPTSCTPTSPGSPAPRSSPASGATTSRSTPTTSASVIDRAEPAVTFLCSPNNPTGVIESPEVVDAVLAAAPGLVVVDEAYAEFSSWSALDRVADEGRLVVVRTFSKTWSMAAARLGYAVAPAWVVDQLDKVVLPYHLDAAKQLAGTLAVRHVDDMDRRVSTLVEERGRVIAGLAELSPAGSRRFRRAPTSSSCASTATTPTTVWQRLARCRRARPRLQRLAAARGLSARHDRTARGERPLPRRARRRRVRRRDRASVWRHECASRA